jgi:hypothetical protein
MSIERNGLVCSALVNAGSNQRRIYATALRQTHISIYMMRLPSVRCLATAGHREISCERRQKQEQAIVCTGSYC